MGTIPISNMNNRRIINIFDSCEKYGNFYNSLNLWYVWSAFIKITEMWGVYWLKCVVSYSIVLNLESWYRLSLHTKNLEVLCNVFQALLYNHRHWNTNQNRFCKHCLKFYISCFYDYQAFVRKTLNILLLY
jgi:hypothetical protein